MAIRIVEVPLGGEELVKLQRNGDAILAKLRTARKTTVGRTKSRT